MNVRWLVTVGAWGRLLWELWGHGVGHHGGGRLLRSLREGEGGMAQAILPTALRRKGRGLEALPPECPRLARAVAGLSVAPIAPSTPCPTRKPVGRTAVAPVLCVGAKHLLCSAVETSIAVPIPKTTAKVSPASGRVAVAPVVSKPATSASP